MRLCSSGWHSIRGRRPTQEDSVCLCRWQGNQLMDPTAPPAVDQVSFLGVYDGHGGDQASTFTAQRLHKELMSELDQGKDIDTACRTAFEFTSNEFLSTTEDNSGTCAVVALVRDRQLHIAHAGDCRAVLCTGAAGTAIRLSDDHKPEREDEKKRIKAAGGSVQFYKCWRVGAPQHGMMLATSRSLGDRRFKVRRQSWRLQPERLPFCRSIVRRLQSTSCLPSLMYHSDAATTL